MRLKVLGTSIGVCFASVLTLQVVSLPKPSPDTSVATVSAIDTQIRQFLEREINAHVADIKSLDPPPDQVVGSLTTGEFSWGTFMRTLGEYSAFASTNTIAGHDVPQMIGKMAEIELNRGGKTWPQLYAAVALRSFGRNLNRNLLWLSLSPNGKEIYTELLNPGRFYDGKTHKLINLPENYFGVAARIAAIDYDLGLSKDRAALDDLLTRAAKQFTDGALFADDSLPTGRYDRYSNEYARAIYDAALLAGRSDLIQAVSPSLKAQMKLWWDLLSPDGYGYAWGRSLGAISYMDTMEIVGFLGVHSEFRPAPLPQLAAAYYAAWAWLRNDYNPDTHLLPIFSFGRGDYAYITKEREWQQTTTFFSKVISAHRLFMQSMAAEGLKQLAVEPSLSNVARFEFFQKDSGREFGVWIVRQGRVHFVLPLVTGPKAATSDYEPIPFGFPGLAVPVEKIYPCLVAFLELDDGRTIAAVDGADSIRPAPDGLSVAAVWRRWAVSGSKPGELVDIGLTSEVTWSLDGNTIRRKETLTASRPLHVRRLWLAVPTRENRLETLETNEHRVDRLSGAPWTLDVELAHADWPVQISALATGDDPLGRSDRGPIPLHLIFESKDISFSPNSAKSWKIALSAQ